MKVILKFSHSAELLGGAWLLKSFQQREGQRILSYTPYSKMAANNLFFCLHVY